MYLFIYFLSHRKNPSFYKKTYKLKLKIKIRQPILRCIFWKRNSIIIKFFSFQYANLVLAFSLNIGNSTYDPVKLAAIRTSRR